MALVQGESFGFFNLDHVDVFGLTEFAPLYDEENGALRAGVRFWQVDSSKPLRATFYEEDGYTNYIWNERPEANPEGGNGRILTEKSAYILKIRTTEADGTEIYDGVNYPAFPIVPLWANEEKQSELVGIQEQIDAYDLIKNGFLNDLDTAQIYWILKGSGGMDDTDLVRFLDRIHTTKMASLDDDQSAEPVTVNIPYDAREKLLDRLESDLYKDYMALNIDEIKGGAVTATQIEAAYEPLNSKADMYEYQIIKFIKGILEIAGIDDNPSFTRSKLINVNESVSTVLQAAEFLEEQYVTEKILTILGDGDKAEEVLRQMESNELEMGGNLDVQEPENGQRAEGNREDTERP
jgi:SPP1 family phage portal protein